MKSIFTCAPGENDDSPFPFLTFSSPCHLCNWLLGKHASFMSADPCFRPCGPGFIDFLHILFLSVERKENGKLNSVAAVKIVLRFTYGMIFGK